MQITSGGFIWTPLIWCNAVSVPPISLPQPPRRWAQAAEDGESGALARGAVGCWRARGWGASAVPTGGFSLDAGDESGVGGVQRDEVVTFARARGAMCSRPG